MQELPYLFRPVGGRIVLDFLNTADWSADGQVAHEKLQTVADVNRWTDALGIGQIWAGNRDGNLPGLIALRAELRNMVLTTTGLGAEAPENHLSATSVRWSLPLRPFRIGDYQLEQLITVSAMAVLSDPREYQRIKMCPGADCGWLFVDETRNGRRKWCAMETCGNRAKARRHYQRSGGVKT